MGSSDLLRRVFLLCLGPGPCVILHAQAVAKTCPTSTLKPACLYDAHLPSWLAFDAELRARTEGTSAVNAQPDSAYAYELTRVRGGIHLYPTEHVSAYLQFHDNHALGLPLRKVQSNMHDAFDLRQGYLELDGVAARFRLGRQELRFGSERLIGVSDWANNSRTFDGMTLDIGSKNHAEFFSTSVVTIHPTSLDTHGAGLTFHGIYATLPDVIPHAILQPFLFFKAIRTVTGSNHKSGSQLEVTAGVELEGKLPKSWNYQTNIALQGGKFASDTIESGALFIKLGHTSAHLPWKPHLTGEFDYATGNHPEVPGRRTVFDQQYPSNHNAFGWIDQFGYQNLRQERIQCEIKPTKSLSAQLQGEALELATRHDSLYGSAGSVLAAVPAGGFSSVQIGKEVDASTHYALSHGLLVQGGLAYFKGGAVFSQTNLNRSELLGYVSITLNVYLGR